MRVVVLVTACTSHLVGVEALAAVVELDAGQGLPMIEIVGLPEATVRESRVRVKAALVAAGVELPSKHFVVNLAPADVRKRGTSFDVAIASALACAAGACGPERFRTTALLGELGLDGGLRSVRGALAHLRSARSRGLTHAILPASQRVDVTELGIDVRVASSLRDVIEWLRGERDLPPPLPPELESNAHVDDLADVRGQPSARRALEIAAVGSHHVLFAGPPGVGKTMLARRLVGLLPPPSATERNDIAVIASAVGIDVSGARRPFRAPHHSASAAALIGGGEPIRPGEVTLAHGGVLFLDELPEFPRPVLEGLRTTIECGFVEIARVYERVRLPAAPLIVAAMNRCPCGGNGDPRRVCRCAPDRIATYLARVSQPLLDRFDLHLVLRRPRKKDLGQTGESTDTVRARVLEACSRRAARHGRLAWSGSAEAALDAAYHAIGLSMRARAKVLRVAETIADLGGCSRVLEEHVAEAVSYRAPSELASIDEIEEERVVA